MTKAYILKKPNDNRELRHLMSCGIKVAGELFRCHPGLPKRR